jgi:MoxR-like ATPase
MTKPKNFKGTDSYIASQELRDAVNVAVTLQKPLLIKGEPGTGKTVLAEAVADQLEMELITWNVKSTTVAQEGLYVYDTVQRLNDSRFGGDDVDVSNVSNYIKFGPLGRAIAAEERKVLLVDEIDKADMEFPNDLLHELDRMSFFIDETGETITAEKRPVVIITSNNEKELPDAFLRRCVFHFISFPEKELMEEIVRVHHPDVEDELMSEALTRFYWLREQQAIRKRPSTSELIDWIAALRRGGFPPEKLKEELPFLGVLLKREIDISALKKARQQATQRQRYWGN